MTLDRKGGGKEAADQGLVGPLLGFHLLFVGLFPVVFVGRFNKFPALNLLTGNLQTSPEPAIESQVGLRGG